MTDSDEENCPKPNKRRRKTCGNPLQPLPMTSKRLGTVDTTSGEAKKAKIGPALNNEEEMSFHDSSAGVLKKLVLTNFMCHHHFTITLNPRINFICGANGSGKSAIQTGLVIGLGGVASKTNRSSKIHGLIRHGCNSGSVAIFLSNYGDNAYKRELYGNTIQIIRNITSNSSNYRVLNERGKLVSSSKREVDNIISIFRIYVNNPISVLNQDNARNFLCSSKPENKYALFRKATLLEETEDLLNQLASEIVEQEQRIRVKEKVIMTVETEMKKMAEQVSLSERLQESDLKKFQLQNELLWSKVQNLRKDLNELKRIKAEQENLKKEITEELEEVKNQLRELELKKNGFQSDKAKVEEVTKKSEETREKFKADFCEKRKHFEEVCLKCEKIERKLANLETDQDHLRKTLDDTEKQDIEQKQKKLDACVQKTEYEKNLQKSESMFKILSRDMEGLKNTIEHFKENQNKIERCIKECHDQIGSNERQLRSLGKADKLSMYDSWMPELVEKINNYVKANKFSKPPRGPLGRYITVKNEKWIYAIESSLSTGTLRSFLVNNANDRSILYGIMKQVIPKGNIPTVHCSKFQDQNRDHIMSDIETPQYGEYSNMFRALTINDTVVANFLMDLSNIHRILLVGKDEDCRHFVSRDENIPHNCQLILNLEADQFLSGFRVYANQDQHRRAKILQKSASDHQRSLREDIAENKEKITELNKEIDGVRNQRQQCSEKMKHLSKKMQTVKSEVIEMKRKIQELNSFMEMEAPSLQDQLGELQEVTKELATLKTELQRLVEVRRLGEQQMKEAKTALHQNKQIDYFQQQTQLNTELDKVNAEESRCQKKVDKLKRQIEEQIQKIQTLTIRVTDMERDLQREENAASELVPEIQDTRTVSDITREIEVLDCFIQEAQRKMGSMPLDLNKEYWKKKNSHKAFLKNFYNLKKLHENMRKMNHARKQMILSLRDLNTSLVCTQFQSVLQSRNYAGNLCIDHKNRKLDILMAPIDGGKTFINTNSLSGGEKSYSTVAFLLALWSCMEIPFYSMDEYDVFMDAINRRTITQLLMDFANRHRSRQFIFLTPLDVSIIQLSKDVQVHRVNKVQN